MDTTLMKCSSCEEKGEHDLRSGNGVEYKLCGGCFAERKQKLIRINNLSGNVLYDRTASINMDSFIGFLEKKLLGNEPLYQRILKVQEEIFQKLGRKEKVNESKGKFSEILFSLALKRGGGVERVKNWEFVFCCDKTGSLSSRKFSSRKGTEASKYTFEEDFPYLKASKLLPQVVKRASDMGKKCVTEGEGVLNEYASEAIYCAHFHFLSGKKGIYGIEVPEDLYLHEFLYIGKANVNAKDRWGSGTPRHAGNAVKVIRHKEFVQTIQPCDYFLALSAPETVRVFILDSASRKSEPRKLNTLETHYVEDVFKRDGVKIDLEKDPQGLNRRNTK